MTHSYMTSVITSAFPEAAGNAKGFRSRTNNIYQVEVVDFDNESRDFEVEARDFQEASRKVSAECDALGVVVNFMNIYKV